MSEIVHDKKNNNTRVKMSGSEEEGDKKVEQKQNADGGWNWVMDT